MSPEQIKKLSDVISNATLDQLKKWTSAGIHTDLTPADVAKAFGMSAKDMIAGFKDYAEDNGLTDDAFPAAIHGFISGIGGKVTNLHQMSVISGETKH